MKKRAKKTTSVFLAVLMIFGMIAALPFTVSATEPAVVWNGTTGDCTWTIYDNGTLTISGNGAMGNYSCKYDNGIPVTMAPWSYLRFDKIVIEAGVTHIGRNAFYNCFYIINGQGNLKSVTISDSVTSIGNSAFRDCFGLKSVIIPDSVTSIGEYTFSNCTDLTSVTIGNSVTSINEYAFSNCTNLTSVTIGNSVTSIGSYAFERCTALTRVTIPGSVTSIGNNAFYKCSGLTSVTIPDSVTSIGDNVFGGCPSNLRIFCHPGSYALEYAQNNGFNTNITGDCVWMLDDSGTLTISGSGAMGDYSSYSALPWGKDIKSVVVENGVTSIGDHAFFNCKSLIGVAFGNSVISIGESAFDGCSSLKSVTIPNSMTSIGNYAFYNCSGLKNVTVSDSVTSIGNNAFDGCPTDLMIYCIPGSFTALYAHNNGYKTNVTGDCTWALDDNGTLVISGSGAMENYSDNSTLPWGNNIKSVIIENGVTGIGKCSFYNCKDLTSVTVSDSVTNIGYEAFYNTAWYNNHPNGLVYAGKVAYKYKGNMPSDSTIVLKNDTKGIADYAFSGCICLIGVTIPDSVMIIGDGAFENCTDLADVTIGNSVTSIGYRAFRYCISLTSLFIPDNVTSIGNYAFFDCNDLTIYGLKGSYAQTYAENNEIPFKEISVSLNKTSIDLTVGQKSAITATIIPSAVSDKSITWSSSDSSVASVSASGVVTAKSAGTAAITARNNFGKSATCTVTVYEPFIDVSGITLNTTALTITKGNNYTLKATVSPSNATDKSVTWSSSDSGVASVSASGVVTAKAAGKCTITAKTNNGKTAACSVTVNNPAIAVTGITLNTTAVTMTAGTKYTLKAAITPGNATNKNVIWSSSDPKIAGMAAGGVINAKTAGTCTITAKTNNGKTATCKVTVKNPSAAVTGIKLNTTAVTMTAGTKYTLKATITPSNATNKSVSWSSSNPKVAGMAAGGVINAKKAGTCTITVKSSNGKTAKCKVTVNGIAPTGVKLNTKTLTITKGKKYTLKATVLPGNATKRTVTWSSGNTKIATVSSGGTVTAKAKGTVTITVKTCNGKTATCKVTVK